MQSNISAPTIRVKYKYKTLLHPFFITLCMLVCFLPFKTSVANANGLTSTSASAKKVFLSTNSLIGEAAIEHLKLSGEYTALQNAWLQAQRGNTTLKDEMTVSSFQQDVYVKASNTRANTSFGQSVAIYGDTVVIGASGESSSATDVNGNQNDNSMLSAGAAYVFVRNGTNWSQQAYLKASNTNAGDGFGFSVAIFDNTVIVGAPDESSNASGVNGNQGDNSKTFAGAAYVFVRNGTIWSQQAYLKASNPDIADLFGQVVAISGDTIVVGAYAEDSNATGINGNQNDNSAPFAGAAYVFTRTGTTWSQQAYLKASNNQAQDGFGWSVAADGDTIVVGANGESSNATGVNGNQNDNSIPGAGAAYVFVRNGTVWSQQAYLKPSTVRSCTGGLFITCPNFGSAVDLSGDTIAVGSKNSVSADIFVRSGSNWVPQTTVSVLGLEPTLALSGDRLVLGANNLDEITVFLRSGAVWSQEAQLHASNFESSDSFGFSVDVAGNTIVAGAPAEDSAATGLNGNQSDNSALSAGAAYIFTNTAPPTPTCAGLTQEAETPNAILTGFTISNDPTASGGSYIGAASSGNYYSGPNPSFKAEYCFNVPTAGTYRIKGKVHAADNFSDSFYVTVDGAPATGYLWDVLQNSVYAMDYVNDRNQADPVEVQLSAGPHYVTVYLREQGTRLDTLALEQVTAPPEPTCAGLVQEAESGAVIGNWGIGNDGAASNGQYIAAPNGSGDFWNGANASQKASYCFNVATAGTYRIKGKVYGSDTLSDSFYVQVDGAPSSGYLWDVLPNTSYTSDLVNDRNVADPVEVQLSAGQHIVNLFVREDGTRLDTIELQLVNSGPPPTPICAGLTQEAESGAVTGNFVIGNDAAASNGAYIHTPSGSGDFWNGPNARHKAEYCFNVPTAGTYRIDGKVYGADTLSDSFYVQVDGAPTNGYLWDVLPNTSYQLDSVSDRNQADPVLVPLSSGQHTVTLYAREDGTRLDTIQLVASTGSATSRALPFLAQGVGGTVHLDATGLNREVDFSTFTVTLLDAETQGQTFRQQVQADRFGNYHFDGMEPGQYIVQLAVPADMVASASSATIDATAAEPADMVAEPVEATAAEPVEVDFSVSANRKTYLPLLSR